MLRRQWGPARAVYTFGLLTFLVHIWCAFQYSYGWSHAVAYRETARQTDELFGVNWGGGLYLNYAFTILWIADAVRSWTRHDWRPSWPMHAFLIFMIVNGTIIVWVLRALR